MAYQINLSLDQQEELKKRKKNQQEGKILRRLIAIEMRHKGMQNKDIADYCGVCADTITDWLCLFEEGGFEALCMLQYQGRRMSKLEPYKQMIKEKEQAGEIASLKQLKSWLDDEHQTQTCLSNLFYFCKKNSLFPIRKPD